jgi:hypothetical protein
VNGIPSQAANDLDLLGQDALALCADTAGEAIVRARIMEVRYALIEPWDARHFLDWFESHGLTGQVSESTLMRLRVIAGVA